jgi:hypothetical protein
MPDKQWTPEPWIADGAYRIQGNADGHRYDIAHGVDIPFHIEGASRVGNLVRATQCVNALAGVDDPAAFVEAVRGLWRACDNVDENVGCRCDLEFRPCSICQLNEALAAPELQFLTEPTNG